MPENTDAGYLSINRPPNTRRQTPMTSPAQDPASTTIRSTPPRLFFMAFVLGLFSASSGLRAADPLRGQPLQPDVAAASEEAEQAVASIRIPDGWSIDLFAAEPKVANIVAMAIDPHGQVYVCESYRQSRGVTDNRAHDEPWLLADLAAKTVQDRIDYHHRLLGDAAITYAQHDDRIRRLTDNNGDGRADISEVIANGFNGIEEGTGAGILVRGDTLYYTCIPRLWRFDDADGDGQFESKKALSDGYGVRVAFRGHDLHGIVKGPDGRLYFSIGDRGYHITTAEGKVLSNPAVGAVFRCEEDGSNLEVFCNGLRNPQELAFNDLGDWFTVDNNSDSGDKARIVHLLQGGDSGWRMYYQYLPDRGPFNREKIWHPYHNEQPAYLNPPVTNFTDGPSGLAFYPGTGFGDALKNKFLICDFRGGPANSGVRSFELASNGATYRLDADDQPIWQVLATDIEFSPDGSIYVSDWVDGWEGLGKGRIYRITSDQQDQDLTRQVAELLATDWTQRDADKLVADLAHVDRRVRLEAQWELADRKSVDHLIGVVGDQSAERIARIHASWGLEEILRHSPDDDALRQQVWKATRQWLQDKDGVLRAAAVKFAGETRDRESSSRLIDLLADPSPRVRYFAAMALSQMKIPGGFAGVVVMLEKNANKDPALRHAGVMFLANAVDPNKVTSLAKHPSVAVRRAAVVALRRMRSERVADFLDDANPLVVTEAARAIYDAPIPVALLSLAERIVHPMTDPALVRRVLAANYRIGGAEQAESLAQYASDETAATDMRIEALQMLASWGRPDPRDRVLNDYRPISPRLPKIAADALRPHVDRMLKSHPEIRDQAIKSASQLGIQQIAPELARRIQDTGRSDDQRASALLALARLDSQQAVRIATGIPDEPAGRINEAALEVLSRHAAKKSVPRFIEATKSSSMKVRQQAWDALASLNDPTAAEAIRDAVDRYLAGQLDAVVELNVLEAARKRLPPEQMAMIDQHIESLQSDEPLARWWSARDGGDAKLGRRLFFEKTELSCVRCHKVDRTGGEVGPELTDIGRTKDRRYLLEAICLPDAQIAKGFETTVVADIDGHVHTGIVVSETDDSLVILGADGRRTVLHPDDIEFRKKGKSSMPADLTQSMTMRELRDLVAYLSTLEAVEDPDRIE
ncbi:PVC-type heme-binding CxxCH protein [Crateriforma spongiae]|uniref:PVC-type heme-binding CxxCH protein n=1 Tax=Crateriforma spongiae TaxID=2724528 RepID=UPI001F323FE9|nr:PVC-type heme-binding CxxCH protein [Crateriforma spongiae]